MQTTSDFPKATTAPSVGSGDLLATPRTDAHLAEMVRLTSSYAAHPDFARELERENARLRDGLKSAEHFLDNATQYIGVINDHDMPKALHTLVRIRAALG